MSYGTESDRLFVRHAGTKTQKIANMTTSLKNQAVLMHLLTHFVF